MSSSEILPAFRYLSCRWFMRATAFTLRMEDGLLRMNSVRMTPVSAALSDAVVSSANCPVATKSCEMDGIPYVYNISAGLPTGSYIR